MKLLPTHMASLLQNDKNNWMGWSWGEKKKILEFQGWGVIHTVYVPTERDISRRFGPVDNCKTDAGECQNTQQRYSMLQHHLSSVTACAHLRLPSSPLSLSLLVCLHLCVSFSLQHKQSKKSNISFRPRIPLLCTQHMNLTQSSLALNFYSYLELPWAHGIFCSNPCWNHQLGFWYLELLHMGMWFFFPNCL